MLAKVPSHHFSIGKRLSVVSGVVEASIRLTDSIMRDICIKTPRGVWGRVSVLSQRKTNWSLDLA